MQIGLEIVAAGESNVLDGLRFGLLMNGASVDRTLRPACDLLSRAFPGQVRALFSPQHGFWGEEQANMIESPHARHPRLGVPVHSLYSEVRRPTEDMLRELDALVVDLQDVGCRVYTFIWTVSLCLEACAAVDVPVIVLDRPNPLGPGFEGPTLDPDCSSFVGRAPIPLRHGFSMGELTLLVDHLLQIGAKIQVVPMMDWDRSTGWPADRCWIPPSPNLPTLDSVTLYPGLVLLEGTNVSEGRGTTLPFQMVGAPWVDGERLARELEPRLDADIGVRAVRFVPAFDKWAGQSCGGVCLHPKTSVARAVHTGVTIVTTIARLWPDEFEWSRPPYEYERHRMPIDILFGNEELRRGLPPGTDPVSWDEFAAALLSPANSSNDDWSEAFLYD